MSREEGIERIYELLGEDLTKRVKQELYKTIEELKNVPDEVRKKIIEKNKEAGEGTCFECPECDGLRKFVMSMEAQLTDLYDPQRRSIDDGIFDYCYEMFEFSCLKCDGSGIIGWKNTQQKRRITRTGQDKKLIIGEARKVICLGLDLIHYPLDSDTKKGLLHGGETQEFAEIEQEKHPKIGKEMIEKAMATIEDPEAHFKDYNDWLAYRKSLEYELEGSEQRYFDFFKE